MKRRKKRLQPGAAFSKTSIILLFTLSDTQGLDADVGLTVPLGDAGSIGEPHVHTGTYEDQDCYNIYVTVDGEAWVYVISTDGEILTKGPGSHSH